MLIALGIMVIVLSLMLARAPQWILVTLLALSVILAAGSVSFGGFERATAPVVAYALALGLLVPAGVAAYRSSRVAPPLHKRRLRGGPVMRRRRTTTKGGDAVVVYGKDEPLAIPGYDVLEKVGSGGMASVFKAKRLSDGKIVALKVPMDQYVADAKFIRRFHREAEVAQRLDHVNIVQTFEHGSLGPQHFMVMEFVDGRSLEGYIEAAELSIDLSAAIMQRVTDALQHIHAAGIIHRDIKPANIMIMRGGIVGSDPQRLSDHAVKLMDFGIAGGKVLSRLTMTGARVGTPVYMSPEQARGLKIDHRSDIYSLGLVFYEMLTGQTAFKGGYEAIVHQQIFQTPAPPRQLNLRVPKALDALVMRMIAKDPDDRPTLAAVLEVLLATDFGEAAGEELDDAIVLTVNSRQGVVRLLDTEGNLHLSLGDLGVADDAFSTAPVSVAVGSDGHLFAAAFEYRAGDESHRMITKLDPQGDVVGSFGPYGMKEGEFLYPASIAVAPDGSVYVLDSETHTVQRFDADGRYLARFGGRGAGQGTFADPRTLAVGPDGRVYVLDYGNRQVQRLSSAGVYETRWAFRLGADQEGMRLIDGFTVSGDGTLFISDGTSGKIRSVTPNGKLGTTYTFEKLHGEASDQLLDLGVDRAGVLYVARRGGHIIRRFMPDGTMLETVETYSPIVHMAVHSKPRTAVRATALRA
ncbi:MAG: protein kinase [Trueperaceae bacterium]|nr:protein kinase [Trueperaceae bacterium]